MSQPPSQGNLDLAAGRLMSDPQARQDSRAPKGPGM